MPKIKILDKSLASKIAAGEVIERPESVLKELLENSIDAGAASISVHVVEGGKRLIRVVDNGCGISREDAPLAFYRHATSKISAEEDLERIMTMGFRGEALASISAVSRTALKTRRPEDTAGTLVEMEGVNEPAVSDTGCPEGTSIEVKDLFFNIPARLKFLRSAESEFGRILDTFKKIALINPDRRMRIVHGSGRPLEAPPGTLRERIADLFGAEISKNLIEIDTPDISGFIGTHELTYATGRSLYIYVNGRAVRDKAVNRAILDGYGPVMDSGRYPFAVLDLKVPPEDVDVNIHPAKSEVRFKNPKYIYDLVKYAVKGALARQGGAAGKVSYESAEAFRGTMLTPGASLEEGSSGYGAGLNQVLPGGLGKNDGLFTSFSCLVDTVTPEFLRLEVIGQLWGEFLLAETPEKDGELYIIDQHGAAERAAFERLKKNYHRGEVTAQLLLIPERVETTPDERDEILGAAGYLKNMGFELVPFGPSIKEGGETFLIKAVPDLLSQKSCAVLIKDLAEELSQLSGTSRVDARIETVLMTIACHSVIRGPRTLSKEEGRALLRDMSKIDFAGHCPHGRPVIRKFARSEIETMFKR